MPKKKKDEKRELKNKLNGRMERENSRELCTCERMVLNWIIKKKT